MGKNAVAEAVDNLVLALFHRGCTKEAGAYRTNIRDQILDRLESSLERLVEAGELEKVLVPARHDKVYTLYKIKT